MTGPQVADFSARLSRELAALSWQDRNELLVRVGRMELRMRAAGQERPIWRGPLPEDRMLGANVVVPTDSGERRGRVICFGVMHTGPDYERTVVVHVPSSGTHHEVPGSSARLASPEDSDRIRTEVAMAERLVEATSAVERGSVNPAEALRRKGRRGLRDPGLIERMLSEARGHPRVTSVQEGGANYKVSGRDPGRRIYLFRSQLRVDLSGFAAEHPGVRPISEQEARDMHLGRVRGQLLFDDRDVALAAFRAALESL